MSTQKARNILDDVRDVMRLHHYSIHTERTYCEWIKKYIMFHGMNSRDDLNAEFRDVLSIYLLADRCPP
ncbi:MAG: phage integrase N-terminal SAM-like domain-containing protein [Thermodesulfobacteriota bacterium]|nr:phage integrase N-terminal SAM-like domain-containing protein [Thermodesulfobacteriota bacterium]